MSTLERPVMVESLEDRRLLAAGPFIMWPVNVVGVPVSGVVQPVGNTSGGKSSSANVSVKTTNLVGDWKGKINVNLFLFVKKKFSAVLDIKSQNGSSITGSITIGGKKYSGTFNGSIEKDGSFSYSLKKGKSSVKIDGEINAKGTFVEGKITAKYSGLSLKGTFGFDKVA